MGNSKKVMLIGWDAADWKVIHKLMDEGKMPTVAKMVENGVMGNMRTLSPVLSPMLWTSIATGKRPYKHGIYGFSEPTPDGKTVQPMTNVSRKCKAIWNILNQNDMESVVVGWWPSHPAEPINGAMVSDYYHKAPRKPGDEKPLLKKCIHPERLFDAMNEMRVHPMEMSGDVILPFIPHGGEIDQEVDSRISLVMRMLAECTTVHAAATHLLETEDWDFAAIYQDAIDHFSHSFMKFHPPQLSNVSDTDYRLFKDVVNGIYIYHDMMLARLMELGGEDTTYIVMSDHGFHPDHLRPRHLPAEPAGPAIEHRNYGIFLASGPGIRKDHIVHGANLLDVTPTILTIYDLPIGEDMDGQPLIEIFEGEPEIKTIPSWEEVEGNDGQHPKDMVIDPQESKEALEQLIALGYIERPDEDSDKAVASCVRELEYNLARSYMDAGMHGEAIPLLLALYKKYPLEFRFGIQLANCLRAKDRIRDLENLVNDLNARWRVAAVEARARIGEVAQIAKERRQNWKEMKEIDEANKEAGESRPRLAKVNSQGKPQLFDETELSLIRKMKAVARGNPQTLDFLAALIAAGRNDFEGALGHLEKAELTESTNPGFLYHVGNVYLGLERHDDAERAYQSALKHDDTHANSLMGLCRTYFEKGNIAKALDFGKQAVGLRFQFPLGHYFYGQARAASGDQKGAVQSLNTAIEQNPNFKEAHVLLASIYKQWENESELAQEHLAAANSLEQHSTKETSDDGKVEFEEIGSEDFRAHLPVIGNDDSGTRELILCIGQPKQTAVAFSGDPDPKETVYVVSGLPRSGTSMMMQMLTAGGLAPHTDSVREADENNPKGYFEAEMVKKLNSNNNWLRDCRGKVVKIVAPLIPYLPQELAYKIIFMERDMSEVLKSQTSMLQRLDKEGADLASERLGEVLMNQQMHAMNLLKYFRIPILTVNYAEAITSNGAIPKQLNDFLGLDLDTAKMAAVVDPKLYRERSGQSV